MKLYFVIMTVNLLRIICKMRHSHVDTCFKRHTTFREFIVRPTHGLSKFWFCLFPSIHTKMQHKFRGFSNEVMKRIESKVLQII
jgi:hypothetical protein